jgi:hypothetical protein
MSNETVLEFCIFKAILNFTKIIITKSAFQLIIFYVLPIAIYSYWYINVWIFVPEFLNAFGLLLFPLEKNENINFYL